ncbi:MAG: hypothetical protein LW860_06280 [Xanthomonadaceae bacterium]|jgi:hypothetical protein|nr:hypothetical protein [Xanthomonadaceae bacterium]
MNVVPLDPVLPEDLRRRLGALPDFAPPPALRERVAARSWNRAASRRPWFAAAAATLLAAVGAAWMMRTLPSPVEPTPDPGTARMALLEQDVHALRVAARAIPPAAATLEGELARIDRSLAASFAAGAPDSTRAALWRDREAVLAGLHRAYRQPDRLIRI